MGWSFDVDGWENWQSISEVQLDAQIDFFQVRKELFENDLQFSMIISILLNLLSIIFFAFGNQMQIYVSYTTKVQNLGWKEKIELF